MFRIGKRPLIAMAMLLISILATADEQVISVQHDSARGATCWVLEGAGLSCLPDSSLPQAGTGTTSPEGQAARASQAVSPAEGALPSTTSLPQGKRAQL